MNKIFSKLRSKKKGFTLIELIVVIVIIGILAAVMIPQFSGFTDKAKSTQALVDAKQIATAYDAISLESGSYAEDAAAIAAIEDMSGVAVTSSNLDLDFGGDGGFEYTFTDDGNNDFVAGRADSKVGVTLDPPATY